MAQRYRWPSPASLDDVFVRHYAGLVARAQQLVARDRPAAEDLVHDVYVRLALRQFDVGAVDNIEAYLFMTLRNVHLSQVRRQTLKTSATVSIIDHESVVSGLRSLATEEERRNAYEALGHVVRYACLRKATSKAASVLILRFFHGYYPAEIARVAQTSETAVACSLRAARTEARAYLRNPGRLRSFDEPRAPLRRPSHVQDEMTSVLALRHAIFEARAGGCLTERALDHLYSARAHDALDVATLAHVVSCAPCLDSINRRLGLPSLTDRDPSDCLGRGGPSRQAPPTDPPAPAGRLRLARDSISLPRSARRDVLKDQAGCVAQLKELWSSKTSASGGGAGPSNLTRSLRTRLNIAREDHPQELRIAVNGLLVSAQPVTGPVNEQRLTILMAEQVGFVEVFDEYDTCLLYLDAEPPPRGAVEQSVRVMLSGGRELSALLAFEHTSPTLHVAYDDPSAATERPVVTEPRERAVQKTRPASWWSFWPVPLRLVLAGVILGLLLANPRRTLAAAEEVRRLVTSSIVRLIEVMRPRAELSSRTPAGPRDFAPFARPIVSVTAGVATRSVAVAEEVSDLELSETALEALRVLDGADALDVEQISVERRGDRRLHVEGVVDTDARREELTGLLRSLPAHRLRVALVTVDEAARRAGPASVNRPLQLAELTRDREPVAYEPVRRSMLADAGTEGVSPDSAGGTDEAVRRFSATVLFHAAQARVQARTVRELVERVSPADARVLSPEALAIWRDMVHRHAERFREETRSIRLALERVFPPRTSDREPAPRSTARPTDPWHAATRAFALGSVHDAAVSQAFAVVAPGSESLAVSTEPFRQSLLEAELLAEAVVASLPDASDR